MSVLKNHRQKVLYNNQPYPDNYTDDAFLASLITNANVIERKYWSVVRDSSVVCQQLSSVMLVSIVAAYTGAFSSERSGTILSRTYMTDVTLLYLDAALLVAGFACLFLLNSAFFSSDERHRFFAVKYVRQTATFRQGTAKSASSSTSDDKAGPSRHSGNLFLSWSRSCFLSFLFFGGIYILSPLLRTLTQSISSDTIYTTSIFLSFIHLFFHDYSYSHAVTSKFSGNASLMAAIFATVLIASLLDSAVSVFALVIFSLEIFVLLPPVLHHVRKASSQLHVFLSFSVIFPTAVLLSQLNVLLSCTFIATIVFIAFVCPFWLIEVQKYKYEIQGPWDEAKLT